MVRYLVGQRWREGGSEGGGGEEREWIGTPCQLDLKRNQEREREHSTGRGGEGHRVASVDVETEPLRVWELRGRPRGVVVR